MAIPFPWTSVVVEEGWLQKNRELAYRYMKCATESIVTLKRNRADSERIIAKYMKITDPKLIATEFDFVSSLMPDYMAPTLEGTQSHPRKLRQRIPRRATARPQGVRRRLDHREIEAGEICRRVKVLTQAKSHHFLESIGSRC